VHLFGAGVMGKRATKLRGVLGVAIADAALFWSGRTAYAAVELIGLRAVLVNVLELYFVRFSGESAKERALLIVAAIASIVIGVIMMRWAFTGAVLVSAIIGIVAAARGISLIFTGFTERPRQFYAEEAIRRDAD